MSDILFAALGYAEHGWHVFPVHGAVKGRCTCGRGDCSSPGKHPLTRHGLKDLTTEKDLITEWWSRWPLANVGIATGGRSHLVVIDIDLGHRANTAFGSPGEEREGQEPNVWSSLGRVIHKLPRTRTALTGGGGLHLLYRARFLDPVRNRTSSLPGMPNLAGIDLRADGGYIVAPPSAHASGNRYRWLAPMAPIAGAPEWLAQEPRQTSPVAPPSTARFTSGDGSAYGHAALENALTVLRAAPIGQRNHTLNRVAFSMARLVTAGHLADAATRCLLHDVGVAMGLTERETYLTIASAFAAGLRKPPCVRKNLVR